jgi:hypothetical protein
MYYDGSHSESRLGISSVVLLAIFVSAFALIVVAAFWRPWADDDSEAVTPLPEVIVEDPAAVEGAVPAAAEGEAATEVGVGP